jgi:hypothetical protein
MPRLRSGSNTERDLKGAFENAPRVDILDNRLPFTKTISPDDPNVLSTILVRFTPEEYHLSP